MHLSKLATVCRFKKGARPRFPRRGQGWPWLIQVGKIPTEDNQESTASHFNCSDMIELEIRTAREEREASEILKSIPPRIADIVDIWAERLPRHPAVVEGGDIWTYLQLSAVIAETRTWLRSLGVRPGDRVMVVCENCRALVGLLFALTSVDAWPVLVNARLSAREVDQLRDHCGARRVFYTTSVSTEAKKHAKRHGATIEQTAHLGWLGIGPLNQQVEPEALDSEPANRVAALIYTSGTTGLPKGVMLTHRNILFVAAGSARIRSLVPDDRFYGVLPISHVVGLSSVLVASLLSGATLYLAPRFDPVSARAALERDRITVLLGAPAMFGLFVEYAKFKGLQFLQLPALRIVSCSGAPLHLTLKFAVEALIGVVLHHGYGITECSPTIAQTRIDAPRTDTSVGPVFPGVQVKLVGADGNLVPEGQVGELWVRGPNVMKGYYRAPDETAKAINPEGWFNTRDLARMESGHLFIVGRSKDLIVRFGFNVYPAEVEAVLNTCPGVARSAVIGRTLEDGNEEVLAFVQLIEGAALTRTELMRHAVQQLAPYKRPSQFFLVPFMPTTLTGKVVKDELAKMLADHPRPQRNPSNHGLEPDLDQTRT